GDSTGQCGGEWRCAGFHSVSRCPMNAMARRVTLLALLALGACQSQPEQQVIHVPEPEPEVQAPPAPDADYIRQQRMLADLLYSARNAVEDNRLMTPAGSNAYDL